MAGWPGGARTRRAGGRGARPQGPRWRPRRRRLGARRHHHPKASCRLWFVIVPVYHGSDVPEEHFLSSPPPPAAASCCLFVDDQDLPASTAWRQVADSDLSSSLCTTAPMGRKNTSFSNPGCLVWLLQMVICVHHILAQCKE